MGRNGKKDETCEKDSTNPQAAQIEDRPSFFCQAERPLILAAPSLRMVNLQKELRLRWIKADTVTKSKFELKALKDQQRYRTEMVKFYGNVASSPCTNASSCDSPRATLDPGSTERPSSADDSGSKKVNSELCDIPA